MASAKRQRPHHFPRPPPGGRPEQKARQAEGEKGKDTMKGGVVKRMVHDLQDGPCVSLPRRGCKASANDTLVARRAKPSRRWSSLAHHPLEPPPAPACSAHNAPPSPPLPSSPPSPLLLTSSSGADHPSPPLRTPSSVTFPCSCLLLPQISGIDCALDSSGPVRQTRHMSWRAATSTSAVVRDRDRRPGCAVRGADGALEIAVRVNATGKVRLFPITRRGAGEGERRRHAQPRRAPPPGPN